MAIPVTVLTFALFQTKFFLIVQDKDSLWSVFPLVTPEAGLEFTKGTGQCPLGLVPWALTTLPLVATKTLASEAHQSCHVSRSSESEGQPRQQSEPRRGLCLLVRRGRAAALHPASRSFRLHCTVSGWSSFIQHHRRGGKLGCFQGYACMNRAPMNNRVPVKCQHIYMGKFPDSFVESKGKHVCHIDRCGQSAPHPGRQLAPSSVMNKSSCFPIAAGPAF